MRLLVTRPQGDATRTADALRALGHEAMVAPLMRVQAVDAGIAGTFGAILITSANAAHALASHPGLARLIGLPVYAVGARGAEAARAAGFADVTSADGALTDLVRLVASHCQKSARLLYLAGEDRAGDLAGDLAAHGIAVETVVIYRAIALDALPAGVAPANLDGALHYSRRSAETLLRLAERAGALNAVLDLAHYCLSAEVAAVLREAGARRIFTAAAASESALFALLPV